MFSAHPETRTIQDVATPVVHEGEIVNPDQALAGSVLSPEVQASIDAPQQPTELDAQQNLVLEENLRKAGIAVHEHPTVTPPSGEAAPSFTANEKLGVGQPSFVPASVPSPESIAQTNTALVSTMLNNDDMLDRRDNAGWNFFYRLVHKLKIGNVLPTFLPFYRPTGSHEAKDAVEHLANRLGSIDGGTKYGNIARPLSQESSA